MRNTHTQLEINLRDLMSFHIRSQLMQMHRCHSKCVCVSLKCTAALDQVDGRVVRDYLIIFRILDSVSSLKIICLEYGLGYAILSASILFCTSYLVNPVLYTFREGDIRCISLKMVLKTVVLLKRVSAWSTFTTIKIEWGLELLTKLN